MMRSVYHYQCVCVPSFLYPSRLCVISFFLPTGHLVPCHGQARCFWPLQPDSTELGSFQTQAGMCLEIAAPSICTLAPRLLQPPVPQRDVAPAHECIRGLLICCATTLAQCAVGDAFHEEHWCTSS